MALPLRKTNAVERSISKALSPCFLHICLVDMSPIRCVAMLGLWDELLWFKVLTLPQKGDSEAKLASWELNSG